MYLVAPQVVGANVQRLRTAMQEVYPRSDVAYSYKTNYNSVLINAARNAGALSEVVSKDEYDYACSLGVQLEHVIYNGVGKRPDELARVLLEPITLIIDSLEELTVVAELSKTMAFRARLGLRVCPALDFIKTPSRFGINFTDEEQLRRVKAIFTESGLNIQGLHLHHSGDRSLDSFIARLQYLREIQDILELEQLQFVDLGGGLASGMPDELRERLSYTTASLEQYGRGIAQAMLEKFGAQGVQLILEPGTGVLADAGVFLTTVLDTKRSAGQSFAVIDGTLFTIDPLRSSVPPLMHLFPQPNSRSCRQVEAPVMVGGNSCMEIDIIHPAFQHALQVNDVLMIAQKGAYASSMATPFIQGIPALVAIDEQGKFSVLRKRTNSQLIEVLNHADGQASTNIRQAP